MKKYIFSFIVAFFFTSASIAQSDTIKSPSIKKWSLGVEFGSSTPSDNFGTGYKKSGFAVQQFQGNLRYMFSSTWGLNGSLSNETFTNGSNSLDFKSSNFRMGLQGVFNVSKALRFENKTISTFIYAGPQTSSLKINEGIYSKYNEKSYGFSIGISPQFNLSNRLVLTTTIDFISDFSKSYNWDGSENKDSETSITNFRLGLLYKL